MTLTIDLKAKKLNLSFPKSHMMAASAIGFILICILIISPSGKVNATRTTIPLSLNSEHEGQSHAWIDNPGLAAIKSAQQDELPYEHNQGDLSEPEITAEEHQDQADQDNWRTLKIKNGQTLSTLFAAAGFNDAVMYSVLGQKNINTALSKIFPGEKLSFLQDDQHQLIKIKLERSPLESIIFSRIEDGSFTNEVISRSPEVHVAYSEGTIDSSLFLAGEKAGLSQSQILDLANIFAWDVDFVLDIREGDKFNLIYEELYLDGEKYKNGRILAAKFTTQGRTLEAVLYKQPDGTSNFFTPDGKSMRKAFIRTPIDFARISSQFNLQRRHPVLNTIRAHKGTDYAAGTGTPIKATGDGKIVHAGRKGGYGNVVIIQHGQNISTVYGHMSRFAQGSRVGARVKQGQVIGYVGSTGLASGPHLHYEFRVNGIQKNPVTVPLPMAQGVHTSELANFKRQTGIYLAQLATFADSYQLATNN